MTTTLLRIIPVILAGCAPAAAQTPDYTNFIRQVQLPCGVQWDATVAASGEQLSALGIDPGGARFELWTIKAFPLTSYLLDTDYVGAYVPSANVVIRSEDPYVVIPRTRADRPFYVDITVGGLLAASEGVPASAQSVNWLRYQQSYGEGGSEVNLDRTQAIWQPAVKNPISTNGTQTFAYSLTSIHGANRAKVRGEERFSVFSLASAQAPETQIASRYIQIWPVADGSIAGLPQGQLIRNALPQVTLTLNDLYPSSTTYAQVYQGSPRLGVTGTTVPGSVLVINDTVPQSRVLTLTDYDAAFGGDGRWSGDGSWTMELLTLTPFGIDRLAYVSFDLKRTMEVNGSFAEIE